VIVFAPVEPRHERAAPILFAGGAARGAAPIERRRRVEHDSARVECELGELATRDNHRKASNRATRRRWRPAPWRRSPRTSSHNSAASLHGARSRVPRWRIRAAGRRSDLVLDALAARERVGPHPVAADRASVIVTGVVKRRRHEPTRPGNPNKFTIEQHVHSRACVKRFANVSNLVSVWEFANDRWTTVGPGAQIFCAQRVWDQRLEHGALTRRIEPHFSPSRKRSSRRVGSRTTTR
jgi:hypothetical protein